MKYYILYINGIAKGRKEAFPYPAIDVVLQLLDLQKKPSFLNVSYVCPERVLAK